jgi:hypothetical protein
VAPARRVDLTTNRQQRGGAERFLEQIAEWLNTSSESRAFVPSLPHLRRDAFGILSARGMRLLRLGERILALRAWRS